MAEWKTKGFRYRKAVTSATACDIFFGKYGGQERAHLNALWGSWGAIMGEDISALGFPIGKNKRVLLVGCEDNMALHELAMQTPEILERANVFMDSDFFENVKVVLMQGKNPLNTFRPRRSTTAPEYLPEKLPELGGLLGTLGDSPIALCYEAYVKFVNELKGR